MRCPKCNNSSKCTYIEKSTPGGSGEHKKSFVRKNFKAKCRACGWEGEC